jgi:hypothetical protein
MATTATKSKTRKKKKRKKKADITTLLYRVVKFNTLRKNYNELSIAQPTITMNRSLRASTRVSTRIDISR